MKKDKAINFKLEISKRPNASGKSELIIRFDISRTNRPTIKTGIFVSPSLIIVKENERDVLYTEDSNLVREARTANSTLNDLEDKISNIVAVTIEAKANGRFSGEVDRDYIVKVLGLKGIDCYSSFMEIKDSIEAIAKEEKAEAERQAKKEEAKSKPTIYQYIKMYCEKEQLSHGRRILYRAFARSLMRYELYRVTVLKQRDFSIDIDTLTPTDVEDFKEYLRNEFQLVESNESAFKAIREKVDEEIPVSASKKIAPRSNNFIIDIMSEFGSVFNWLLDTDKTLNNPFKGVKKGTQVYGTPIYLTEEERDHIATFNLVNDREENGEIKEDKRGRKLDLIRDIFVFQCLIGSRFGDLSRMTEKDNIDNDLLVYYPSKNLKHAEQKKVVVPLDDEALRLIAKYRGADSKGRLFPCPPATTFNDNIKVVFEKCGITRKVVVLNPLTGKEETKSISEVVASHMARRTFAGNLYNELKDPNIICSMTGHADGSKAFSRYRTIDLDMKREAIKLLHKNKTQEPTD